MNRTWDLGLTACLFWTGSDVFLSTTSIMHLCAIAIHRHLGIAYPLRMRRGAQNRRHVLCLLLPAWTVSAAVSASLVVQGAMNRHTVLVPLDGRDDKMVCGIYDHTFAIYSSMLSFFVPLAVMVAVDVRSVQILRTARRRDVFAESTSLSAASHPSRDVSSHNVTSREISSHNVASQVARESITAVELTSTSPMQALSPSAVSQTVATAEKSGFLRPRLDTHPNSAGPERSTAYAEDTATRRSTLTPRLEDISTHHEHQQPAQRPAKPDHLRVHTGTGGRLSRSYIRFPAGARNSLGVVKMHGRERRAGRTLIWVFAIFVALWLPFFCTNLAYGLCGVQHNNVAASSDNSSRLSAATTTTTTTVFGVVPDLTVATNRSASDAFGGDRAGCNIPESVFMAFTWLGYLSSGMLPVVRCESTRLHATQSRLPECVSHDYNMSLSERHER